ncbi:collagenase [Streptomyces sp. TRM68416]|uniref:collagenase n=1 Tax=Streptomyces sp. TRM68416 TaxID=2758412 RepID=UPI001662112D|nr:collagenase [Streptomyces sp. TRM68416]MBD0839992.1 collagenase [Streptomyces sp. TRM68416]
MRYRFTLPRCVVGGLAAFVTAAGLLATPATAAPAPTAPAPEAAAQPAAASGPRPAPRAGTPTVPEEHAARQTRPLSPDRFQPLDAPRRTLRLAAQACDPADFATGSGAELVAAVRAASTGCVNTLFGVSGATARDIFREDRMVAVAKAFAGTAAAYPGDNSTSARQLVLFLRAGYYVQFNHPEDVGSYGPALASATRRGLDVFFANRHSRDVSSGNGDILAEAVVLTDSADQQARYLRVYRRILSGYNSSYDAIPGMLGAVNSVHTPLWRGNWNPAYVRAVAADPAVLDSLFRFALRHRGMLGGERSYLVSNAGMTLTRHVEHPALRATVRPYVRALLKASRITGRTAPLWVAVASQAEYYDKERCSWYGVCGLRAKLLKAALPVSHPCDATHTVRAQALTAEQLAATCADVQGQEPYFRSVVKSEGPIPGQYASTLDLVVFASRTDYQTYAGTIFGIDTNNGGMTLVGDPSDPANKPLAIMYQKEQDNGFTARIWNLNHEYTHYLDAREDMKGDFGQQISVPTVWWIEGIAEYVSYSYRGLSYPQAIAEAGKHTYRLSTLFQNTYGNSDVTRTYAWGYLAARYMLERHPEDVADVLAHFRTGDYRGGYAVYTDRIGTAYDADFDAWLTDCAAGACERPAA